MKSGCALKVDKCKFENLPISLSSHKNNMSKIFTLKNLTRFEIDALKICEKFVYKHWETIG